MLIYNQAYDAYHCFFRMIGIVDCLKEVEVDKVRIIDFYMLFPGMISEIRIPKEYSYIRKVSKNYKNIYHDPISSVSTFNSMQEIQISAIKFLCATGLVDEEFYKNGILKRSSVQISDNLQLSISSFMKSREDISKFLLMNLSRISLLGKDGLKDRTRLMEYRYDYN